MTVIEEEAVTAAPLQEKSVAKEIQSEVENVDHTIPNSTNEVSNSNNKVLVHVPARYSTYNDQGEKISSTNDLVQQVQYLYVRVIKANGLNATRSSNGLYVKITVGDQSDRTRDVIPKICMNLEWNEVFDIAVEDLNNSTLVISC